MKCYLCNAPFSLDYCHRFDDPDKDFITYVCYHNKNIINSMSMGIRNMLPTELMFSIKYSVQTGQSIFYTFAFRGENNIFYLFGNRLKNLTYINRDNNTYLSSITRIYSIEYIDFSDEISVEHFISRTKKLLVFY